jgi:hypothetical protein
MSLPSDSYNLNPYTYWRRITVQCLRDQITDVLGSPGFSWIFVDEFETTAIKAMYPGDSFLVRSSRKKPAIRC